MLEKTLNALYVIVIVLQIQEVLKSCDFSFLRFAFPNQQLSGFHFAMSQLRQ